MRLSPVVSLAVLSATSPAVAQNPPIDFNAWTVEHINGTGPWNIDAPRMFCNSTNAAITDCSTFYSDFQVSTLDFTMSIHPDGGDDDICGFLLGWLPGDAANPSTADYLVVDWKRTTQAFQNWGTAQAGLALSRMQGSFTPGYGNAPIDLWSHTGNCTELARGNQYGNIGWSFATDYVFRVVYTPTSVVIFLNDQPEFAVAGTFPAGRFACYNFSQARTGFQFPLDGSFVTVGTGCAGSAGTPYLFAPTPPYVGESLPIIVANLPPVALCVLVLGASNSSWGGLPLPLSLAPLGAAGCTAYTSPDTLLPITDFNGTGFTLLPLPATLVPSTIPLFFAQAFATDFAANPLGLVFSNGAEAALGIR